MAFNETITDIKDSTHRYDLLVLIVVGSLMIILLLICCVFGFKKKKRSSPDISRVETDEVLLRTQQQLREQRGIRVEREGERDKEIVRKRGQPDTPPPSYITVERDTSFTSYISQTSSQFEIPPNYDDALNLTRSSIRSSINKNNNNSNNNNINICSSQSSDQKKKIRSKSDAGKFKNKKIYSKVKNDEKQPSLNYKDLNLKERQENINNSGDKNLSKRKKDLKIKKFKKHHLDITMEDEEESSNNCSNNNKNDNHSKNFEINDLNKNTENNINDNDKNIKRNKTFPSTSLDNKIKSDKNRHTKV